MTLLNSFVDGPSTGGGSDVHEESGEYYMAYPYYDGDAGGTIRMQIRSMDWHDDWPALHGLGSRHRRQEDYNRVSSGKLIGTVRANRDVNGLVLSETEYESGLSIEPHPHAEPLICVVLAGAMTERWGRSKVFCDTGTLTYLPPDEPHGVEFEAGDSRCFLMQLGPSWVRRMRDLDLNPRAGPFPLKGARANWLTAQIYREFRSPDDAAELAAEGFALAMLGELARAGERRERESNPPWLRRAVEMLHDRMAEPVRMAEIAAEVDIHPTHLARTFRERYHCTMGEYLRRIRIDAARAELVSTDKSLSSVALAAGFADQAHFTRTFKRVTGHTPGAWRQVHSVRLIR